MHQKLIAVISSLVSIWLSAFAALADTPGSRLSVPVSIDLNGLRAFIEDQLPTNPLYWSENIRTCAEPRRVCTKVPEFRGLKVTMKNRCVEVTPRIDCTVTERIDRQNAIEIGGTGGTIIIRQDIFGSGTVSGRGEVGKNIQQTVRAAAEFEIATTPVLNADWLVSAKTSISKVWLQRPEFTLFNMFPITLGSQIDPMLDAAMRKFEAKVPNLLAGLKVKEKVEALWQSIQKPIRLTLHENHEAFLHLRPAAVSFHGINIVGRNLITGLSLSFHAMADFSADGPPRMTLPNLTELPEAGFNIRVPVQFDNETLNKMAAELLPYEMKIGGEPVAIQRVHVGMDGKSLILNLYVKGESGITAALSGPLEVRVVPQLLLETQHIVLDDIKLAGVAGQTSFDRKILIRLASAFIQTRFETSLAADMDVLSQKLTEALNGPLSDELSLSGSGKVSLADISLVERADSLTVTFAADGQVSLTGFKLFK